MSKRKERKELERELKKVRKEQFYKLLVDEIGEWGYGITHKDFSSLIKFYKENEDIVIKYSKLNIRNWTFGLMNEFMYIFEIREKLANFLNRASITYEKKIFRQALIYYKKCTEGKFELIYNSGKKVSKLYHKSLWYLGVNLPVESSEFHNSLDTRRKQVWKNFQATLVDERDWSGRYEIKLEHFLEERISEIESELEAIDDYKRNIDYLHSYLKQKKYNQAFNNYIKALSYKDKIKNKNHFLDKENEKKIENGVKNILLNLSIIIKRTVLDLGTKFTRLEIREISEKCNVDNEDLIIEVVKNMIENKEIYAEYFKSTNSISFNQQANIEEIDKLMEKYKHWEEEGISKK